MRPPISLEDAALLTAVVTEGGVAAAARSLDIPKSTVSRRLRALQQRVGVALVAHRDGAFRPTEAGVRFAERFAGVIEQAEQAHLAVADAAAPATGLIRILAPAAMGPPLVGALVAEFLRKHLDVQAELEVADDPPDTVEERFDVVLRIDASTPDPSVIVRRLGGLSLVLCATPGFLAAHGTPARPADLARSRAVAEGEGIAAAIFALRTSSGTVTALCPARLTVNHCTAVYRAVLGGIGIGALPLALVQPDLDRGRLARVLPDCDLEERPLCALIPSRRHLGPAVRAFLDHVTSTLAGPPSHASEPDVKHSGDRLRDMAIFVKVVDSGSLTDAGRALGLPKSTVSRRLDALEEGLGVRLATRSKRGLVVSEIGMSYYQRALRVLGLAEDALQAVVGEDSLRGHLRMTAPREIGALIATDVLCDFLGQHPGVTAELVLSDQRVDLAASRFDLALRIGRDASAPPGFENEPLSPIWILLCASPAYAARHGLPQQPAELSRHQVVRVRSVGSRQWRLRVADEVVLVDISGRLLLDGFSMAQRAVEAGLGIGPIAAALAGPALRAGQLVHVLPAHTFEARSLYAVYPGEAQRPPRSRRLIEHMVTHLRRALSERLGLLPVPRPISGTPGSGARHSRAPT